MRNFLTLFTVLTLVAVAMPVLADEAADTEAIKAAALDYAMGWYLGDADQMERALHPELAKRIVRTENGRSRLDNMGAMRLVQYARKGYGKKTPEDQRQADVEILDVFENVASVRLTMVGWIDYLHIARYDGRWVIVNVLWEMKPGDD